MELLYPASLFERAARAGSGCAPLGGICYPSGFELSAMQSAGEESAFADVTEELIGC